MTTLGRAAFLYGKDAVRASLESGASKDEALEAGRKAIANVVRDPGSLINPYSLGRTGAEVELLSFVVEIIGHHVPAGVGIEATSLLENTTL